MSELNMVEAIRSTLAAELERDERVILLGQDIGALGGVFRVTEGLQDRFGADRVVDAPLAEGVIVGSAIGLAMSGLVPVAEIQFLGFAAQAFHQFDGQLTRMRQRSGGRFPMPVVVRAPFGGNVRTPELHSDALEMKYLTSPGLQVVAPATANDAKGMLATAIRSSDPTLFLEPLRGYRLQRDEVPDDDYTTPFGVARTAREGGDVTIIAWSGAVHVAEEAAELCAADGISCTVLDLRSLVPFDEVGVAEAAAKTGRVVIVHEAPMTGGFGGELIATIQEQAFYSLEAPIRRVTAPDAPYPIGPTERHYIPTAARVADAVRKAAEA
jgi:pyruvate dehydrogenase E1 component beta subunit